MTQPSLRSRRSNTKAVKLRLTKVSRFSRGFCLQNVASTTEGGLYDQPKLDYKKR